MGFFDSVEKRLEGAISGVFAKAFKGEVEPVEITARLQRELDAEATVLGKDRKLVPNAFIVTLSSHDFARLTPYAKTMNAEIATVLAQYASERGYVLNGHIVIDYAEDEELAVGRIKVESTAAAGVDADDVPVPPRKNAMFVEVNGVRHPLTPPGLTIGRGSEVDLRINDPGISREHARIDVEVTASGPALSVTDLGSTNGIKVDGRKTAAAPLAVGSVVDMGKTKLRIVTEPNV
jgi:hypothetical protein